MPKLLDPATLDFTQLVRSGDLVVYGQVGAEPLSLTEPLMRQSASLGGIRALLGFQLGDTPLLAPPGAVRFYGVSGFMVAGKLQAERRLEIVPAHFFDYSAIMREAHLRPDVVLVQVSPPDGQGRHNLGVGVDHMLTAIERARVVIAEVNDRVPWVEGDGIVDGDVFDYVIHASRPPIEWAPRAATEVDEAVAANVARLVPDRATVQYGIGSGPDAIVKRLAGKRDLGIHSGSLADSFVDLVEAGAVTNRYKEIDDGASVSTILYGTRRLYDHFHRNPRAILKAATHTHHPGVLARMERLYTINAALEVDLTGQVGAEASGRRYIGATGGQVNFQRAGLLAREGRSIIALGSTTGPGGRTRIVSRLNGPVTTLRTDADVFVTEYGIAELRGRSLHERAEAMIAIAHPDHRDGLREGLDDLV